MAQRVSLSFDYGVPPDRLWALVTNLDALARVNAPRLRFDGLPSGRIHQGQEIAVRVSVFGILPAQDYTMRVITCDDDHHHFQSAEHGAGVRQWDHDLRLTATASGTRLDETITIDAGALTPLYGLWARYLYRARHPARLRLLYDERTPR